MDKKESLNKLIRKTYKYKQWRWEVIWKDDITCQVCGMKGGQNLDVDHYPKRLLVILSENKIKSLEEALNCKELWDKNNGRLLCTGCHKKTDSYGWKAEGMKFEVKWRVNDEDDPEEQDLMQIFSVEVTERFFTREEAENFAVDLKNNLGETLVGEINIYSI